MTSRVVLAVDDEPANLQLFEAIFEDSAFELRLASSGTQALQILEAPESRIDLVILDRLMPVLDGLTVLERLKQDPRLARVPVVMQTAAADPAQVEEGLKAGAHYYLTKPFSPAALYTIVASALGDAEHRVDLPDAHRYDFLATLDGAVFVIRTLDEAEQLANLLCRACPDPTTAWTGLHELLTNAVEHGNLGISYEEKAQLKREDRWREEVDRRAELPEHRDRRVRLSFERSREALTFVITDEGAGFAWERYLDFDPARAFDPNGRGIALAHAMCFDELRYLGRGNSAVARIALSGPDVS